MMNKYTHLCKFSPTELKDLPGSHFHNETVFEPEGDIFITSRLAFLFVCITNCFLLKLTATY